MDNSTQNMSEKLVQYLDGELTGAEIESLEKQLATDKNLNEELESLKATREAVKIFGLQQKVAGIHTQMMKEMQAPVRKMSPARRIIRYSIAVAASVVLILGSIIGYNFYNLSSSKVFSSNYHSYELSTLRDSDTQQVSPVEKAYRDKDFKKAVELFDGHSSVLAGMSYMELGDNAKAIDEFKNVIAENEKNKTTLFNDEAEYYLALTYIRNKDYDFALVLLRSIKENPDHLYHKNVSGKLMRQVKMLKWR
jgi:tetratricopeptide (TPR) repeat protein